jgi:hypothetical protein
MRYPMSPILARAAVAAALLLARPPVAAFALAPEDEKEEERERQATPDRLSAGLEARIEGKKSATDFRIQVEWPRDGVLTSCWIFGDGVGLWNRQIQFRIPAAQVKAVMKEVRKEKFGALPEIFGENEGGEAELKGRITVSLGSTTKVVQQRSDGDQSETLQQLATFVFGIAQEPSRHGVTTSSLADALQMVEAGTLSPEVFEVLAQRKVDHPSADKAANEQSWILRINGTRVSASAMKKGAPPSQRELRLTKEQFRDLLKTLQKSDPASLPKNLWAPQYTVLRIQALNQVSQVSARPFAGMTAQTHAEKQQSFDEVWGQMAALYKRVQKTGKPVAAPPASPAPDRDKDEDRDKDKDKDKDKNSATRSQPH